MRRWKDWVKEALRCWCLSVEGKEHAWNRLNWSNVVYSVQLWCQWAEPGHTKQSGKTL